MSNKKSFYIVGVLAVLVIITIIMLILLTQKRQLIHQGTTPTISPTLQQVSPTLSQINQAKKLLDAIENRKQLNSNDELIRKSLTNNVTPQNDIINMTDNYIIEYVQAPDDFEVEILSPNVTTVKQEVVDWFISKGISKEGVCNLPIIFSISPTAAQGIPAGQSFSRLPDGC